MSRITAKTLPEKGHDNEEVLRALDELRAGDVQWRRGRALSLVYHGGENVSALCQEAYASYFSEDGHNIGAFPSLRRLEAELLSMIGQLLGGDDEVTGTTTSGVAENALLVIKAARAWAKENHPKITRPEVILPQSAHPSYIHAAELLGVKPVVVALDRRELDADMKEVTQALSERTILLLGSAPSHPHGIIDPIDELARIAEKRGLLCHVDASLGAFVLPFLRQLNEPIPPFDFALKGVSSIAADLHAYGYGPLGAAALLYRTPKLRRHQFFANTEWPGGLYASPSLSDARPGAAIAASWAVMSYLGAEGYRAIAKELMDTTHELQRGIASIEGLRVVGHPQMSVMAVTSKRHDIFELGDHLAGRGWHIERQHLPPSLHITVTRSLTDHVAELVEDLREAAEATTQEPTDRLLGRTRHLLVGAAARVLPKKLVSRVTTMATKRLGVGKEEMPTAAASLHGILTSFPNRGDLHELALDTLDGLLRYDPSLSDILPSKSVMPAGARGHHREEEQTKE